MEDEGRLCTTALVRALRPAPLEDIEASVAWLMVGRRRKGHGLERNDVWVVDG